MLENIVIIVFGIFCLILCFLLLRKKEIDKTQNNLIRNELIELSKERDLLKEKISALESTNIQLYDEKHDLQTSIESIKAKRDEINYSIDLLKKQSDESAKQYKEDQIKIAQEQANQQKEKIQQNLDKSLEEISNNYKKNVEEYQSAYLEILNDAAEETQNYLFQTQKAKEQLDDVQKKVSTAIELEKIRQADEMAEQKYKILLSDEDLVEIKRLREVAPFLRNARPVYKIIWEGYYRNPTNDLISRVLNNKNITGIYLITNTLNQMSYIGQATNVSDRWKQHIKCGLGIDTPNNILYQAMKKDGVENFKFQLIEKCNREDLNNKEKYWIEFYKTNDFGYNMTKGNK